MRPFKIVLFDYLVAILVDYVLRLGVVIKVGTDATNYFCSGIAAESDEVNQPSLSDIVADHDNKDSTRKDLEKHIELEIQVSQVMHE